jgi:hypothetical protein
MVFVKASELHNIRNVEGSVKKVRNSPFSSPSLFSHYVE